MQDIFKNNFLLSALNATPNEILLDFIDISVLTDSEREIDKEFNELYIIFLKLSLKDKKNVMALINSMLSN